MYPSLLHGAYEVLKAHAVPALRELYLAKLSSGEWLGTMCLTEPQAGSDLGRMRTRADLVGQGSTAANPAANGAPVLISGGKTFISGGGHDLTDNIVHLVLANGPLSPKRLAQALALSAPNLTMLLDRLRQRGLLRRERSLVDRHSQNVVLTDEGQRIAQAIAAEAMPMARALDDRLSLAEPAMLIELLCKVAGG